MSLIRSEEFYINSLSEKIQIFDEKLATVNDYDDFYQTLGKFIESIPEDFNFWKHYIQCFVEHLRKAPVVSFANWNLYFVSNVPKMRLPAPLELVDYVTPYLEKSNIFIVDLTEDDWINMANATIVVAMFIQYLYKEEEVVALFRREEHLFSHLSRIIVHHKGNITASTYATMALLGAFRVNNMMRMARQSEALRDAKNRSNLPYFIRALKVPAEICYEKGEAKCKERDAKVILRSVVCQCTLHAIAENDTREDDLSRNMWIYGTDHQFGWSNHQSLTPIEHDSGKKFYFEVFHLAMGSLRVGIAHKPTERQLANWFDLAACKSAISFDAFEKIHWLCGKERTCTGMNRPEKEGYTVGVTIDTSARSALELIQFTLNGQKVESDPPEKCPSRHYPYAAASKKRKTLPIWHQPYYISLATSALQSCIVLRKRETWSYAPPDADQLSEVLDCQFVRIKSNLNPKGANTQSPAASLGSPDGSQTTTGGGVRKSRPRRAQKTETSSPKYHLNLRKFKRRSQNVDLQEQQPQQEHQLEQEQEQPMQQDDPMEQEQELHQLEQVQQDHQQEHDQVQEYPLEQDPQLQPQHQEHQQEQEFPQEQGQPEQHQLQYQQPQTHPNSIISVAQNHLQVLPAVGFPTVPSFAGEQIVIQSVPAGNFQNQIPQLQGFQPVNYQQQGIQNDHFLENFQPIIPNSCPSAIVVTKTMTMIDFQNGFAITKSPSAVSSPAQSDSSLLHALGSPLSQMSQSPPYISGETPLFTLSPSHCSSPSLSIATSTSSSETESSPVYQSPHTPSSGGVSSGGEESIYAPDLSLSSTSKQQDSPLPPVQHLQQIQQQANRQHKQQINKSREESGHFMHPCEGYQCLIAEMAQHSQKPQIQITPQPINYCIVASESAPLTAFHQVSNQISYQVSAQPFSQAFLPVPSQDESVVRRTFVDLQSKEQHTAQSVQAFHVPETIGVQNERPLPRTGFIQTEHGILFCKNGSRKKH